MFANPNSHALVTLLATDPGAVVFSFLTPRDARPLPEVCRDAAEALLNVSFRHAQTPEEAVTAEAPCDNTTLAPMWLPFVGKEVADVPSQPRARRARSYSVSEAATLPAPTLPPRACSVPAANTDASGAAGAAAWSVGAAGVAACSARGSRTAGLAGTPCFLLHRAVAGGAPAAFCRALLRANKAAAAARVRPYAPAAWRHRLPLHLALEHRPQCEAELVQDLLRAHKDAAHMTTACIGGQLPLQLALAPRCRTPLAVVRMLLAAYPAAVSASTDMKGTKLEEQVRTCGDGLGPEVAKLILSASGGMCGLLEEPLLQ